ncbi:prolyl 4-hydroxylase subunit alpha-2 [Drosophila novamexicana]|uniref:prolyl 4-hydroxylase subunit alpha-2 n=1 Tax=Drosophila novamexicana TaxID=47314 RepID=UPI0011E5C50D|nr:prolyl 4-hydroxylase subunit alpha-2 [Drosophila novamexicana]
MLFLGAQDKPGALLAVLTFLVWSGASAEFYSSIHAMSRVFGYEQQMLQHMQKFIADNESKLDFLRARLDEFERERNEAQQWGVAYFESPLNKYLLSKRLTRDWQHIANLMAAATGKKPLVRLQWLRQQEHMPNAQELEGAIDGLLRLQSIYRLQTSHVAAGILDGVPYGTQLNAQHCLDIAQQALRDEHLQLAHAWLLEAKSRLSNSDRARLQPLIFGQLGQVKARLTHVGGVNGTLQSLKELEPGSERYINNYKDFQTPFDELNPVEEHPPLPENLTELSEFDLYRYTCNGYIKPTPAELRQLRCGYMTETHPFLLLAPLKVEELSHDPLLVLYHDVIYQSEIDTLAKLTKNKIHRATVTGNNASVVSNSRTSQFTFIPKTRHKVLRTIDQRVADMTDLNMVFAEDHQLANYGIGGHYAQHMDWFSPNAFETKQVANSEMGNRIATVLFYLTDVEQGGGTAFPVLKQLLKPKKYAAAFWYNLHASGAGDVRTMHGACPIIVGSKWVLNRWIREFVQSDRRPCHLWDDSQVMLSQLLELSESQVE